MIFFLGFVFGIVFTILFIMALGWAYEQGQKD